MELHVYLYFANWAAGKRHKWIETTRGRRICQQNSSSSEW